MDLKLERIGMVHISDGLAQNGVEVFLHSLLSLNPTTLSSYQSVWHVMYVWSVRPHLLFFVFVTQIKNICPI